LEFHSFFTDFDLIATAIFPQSFSTGCGKVEKIGSIAVEKARTKRADRLCSVEKPVETVENFFICTLWKTQFFRKTIQNYDKNQSSK
jgi:hypothetical protein